MVAGEGGLVEDGLVSAEEGPVEGLGDAAEVILDRQADVEHLGNKKKNHYYYSWLKEKYKKL